MLSGIDFSPLSAFSVQHLLCENVHVFLVFSDLCMAELGQLWPRWKATFRIFLGLESPSNFPVIICQPRGSGFTER